MNHPKLWTIKAKINGVPVDAMIDSGATISVVSKRFVPESQLKNEDSIAVQVANGQTVYTIGSAEMVLELGDNFFSQKAQVLDTNAFEAILGLDFLS